MTTSPEPDERLPAIGLEPRDWGRKTWKGPFLEVLARTRSPAAAARAVHRSRTYCHDERVDDPEFALAWEEALVAHTDLEEQEAIRQALVGAPRKLTRTTTRRDKGGNVIETTVVDETSTRPDSRLLAMMLQAHRPEIYGDHVRHTLHGGTPIQVEVGPREWSLEQMAQLFEIALEAGVIGASELPVIEQAGSDPGDPPAGP